MVTQLPDSAKRQYINASLSTGIGCNHVAEKKTSIFFERKYFSINKNKNNKNMPIFYNKVQKVNPRNPGGLRLWYPVIKSTKLVKEQELAKRLSKNTTLNEKEAEMAIYLLMDSVVELLSTSHTVQLGRLGSFRVTGTSEGSATAEEVDASKVKKLNVRFTESNELKEEMKKVNLVDLASLSTK
jgi:predicted histone-like DNA-binding protein